MSIENSELDEQAFKKKALMRKDDASAYIGQQKTGIEIKFVGTHFYLLNSARRKQIADPTNR